MFDKRFLDELDIEKGALEIAFTAYHFHKFREDLQEARSFKNYDLPLKQHYVESAKGQFKLYKHCVSNAYHYLGASNKEAVDKLVFKYKYQQQEPSVAEVKKAIKK